MKTKEQETMVLLHELKKKMELWSCSIGWKYMDAFLSAMKAFEEVQEYRKMKERLKAVYGECDGLLESAIDSALNSAVTGHPTKTRLLTDEDVDNWEAYKSIGTPEECRLAMKEHMENKSNGLGKCVLTVTLSSPSLHFENGVVKEDS